MSITYMNVVCLHLSEKKPILRDDWSTFNMALTSMIRMSVFYETCPFLYSVYKGSNIETWKTATTQTIKLQRPVTSFQPSFYYSNQPLWNQLSCQPWQHHATVGRTLIKKEESTASIGISFYAE